MQTSLEINANGEVWCPDCGEMVHVGAAGIESPNDTEAGESLCWEQEKKWCKCK